MNKRLTKSSTHKILFGVLGGVAEYYKRDATSVRLLYLLLVLVTGIVPGILIYIIAAAIMPDAVTPSAPVNDPEEV